MNRHFFNTTGPCNPEDHYMLDADERLVGAQLHRYIRDKLYWVLHAPRQTGKTTFLHSWMRQINAGTEAISCYVSMERCQGFPDPSDAMPLAVEAIRMWAERYGLPVPAYPQTSAGSMLNEMLSTWAAMVAPKPLVVLFDEVDVLSGNSVVSFLRQLRDGFASRGVGKFPVSIVLVGMRDLKDYITAAKDGIPPNPGSPFNIKEDSVTLSNFSEADIIKLFSKRTSETGQQISCEALDYVYDQSRGQPWIVNSLFKRATMRVLTDDSCETVTIDHVTKARTQMIEARETHLDALGERLKDPRIRGVIQPIITGEVNLALSRTSPDVQLAMDLGLVRWDSNTGFTIANPVYEEILTRYLNAPYHDNLPPPSTWHWQKADGSLDMDSLLKEFQSFWQQNSEVWEQGSGYTEAFPHLLLMAFLQRIINGGGRIEREYAAGSGRMDLAIEYRGEWNIIEVKIIRAGRTFNALKEEGIRQTLRYRDSFSPPLSSRNGKKPGCYLVIFDRTSGASQKPWNERIKWMPNAEVTVVGC